MEQGFDVREKLMGIVDNLIQSVTAAAPRVLTGIVVIALAVLGAKLIQKVLGTILRRTHFDKGLEKIGLDGMLRKVGMTQPASVVIPRIVYYLLLFLFGQAIVESLGLTTLSNAIGGFLGYLPNVFAAMIVVVVGTMLGQYSGALVTRAAGDSGIDFAATLGSLVSGLVMFIAGIMAIAQLQIDTEIIRIVTLCSLAGLGLAFGLSFGLGSRDFTRNLIAGFYAKKLVGPGDDVEIGGQRGTIREMTATHVVVEGDDRRIAVTNGAFIEQVIRR